MSFYFRLLPIANVANCWIKVFTFISIDRCVFQVAHSSIRDQLLDYIYNGFLVPVLAPALHKVRSICHYVSFCKKRKKINSKMHYSCFFPDVFVSKITIIIVIYWKTGELKWQTKIFFFFSVHMLLFCGLVCLNWKFEFALVLVCFSVKLTLEEVMTTTAYLDLFLRSVSEPALLQTFLSFILLHQHEAVHILDTLVSRVNTPFQVWGESRSTLSLDSDMLTSKIPARWVQIKCKHRKQTKCTI